MPQKYPALRRAGALAGAMLLLAAAAPQVLAESISMRFDVNVSGMKAMKLTFDGDIGKSSYSGHARLKPRGFAKLFIKKSFSLSVKGRLNDDHVRPEQFSMTIRKKKEERVATVRWSNGRLAQWRRTPPKSKAWRQEVLRALKGGVMDPLSMLVRFARARSGNFCKGRVRIFDGHDVYDIIARSMGGKNVRTRVYSGPALVCRLKYVPVAGQSDKKRRRRLADPPLYITYLARVKSADSGALYVPVRVEGRFDGRPFVAEPVTATLGGKALVPAGR